MHRLRHCSAGCSEGAIRVSAVSFDAIRPTSCNVSSAWLAPGDCDGHTIFRLLASRRSCRHYAPEPIEGALLEDLVRAAVCAPSAGNDPLWSFTILADSSSVQMLDSSSLVNQSIKKPFRKS